MIGYKRTLLRGEKHFSNVNARKRKEGMWLGMKWNETMHKGGGMV